MTDDKQIIGDLQKGDRAAFERFVMSYQVQVFNTCYSFLNHREDAEDIAQEVFIDTYRSIDTFRGESSLSTWLYRMAMNKSLDFLRAKKRKKRGSGLLSLVGNAELEQLNISDYENPELALEEEEQRQILLAAIAQLPERQQVAITLSKLEGLSQEQIAVIMNTSVSSVESLLVRAKRKLKTLLLHYFSEKEKETVQEIN